MSVLAYTVELLKKGRRLYGAFYRFRDGRHAYFAYRKQAEIYRDGRPTISEAMRDGVAGWALDDETLLMARARGVRYVGVIVRDTGDIYVTHLDRFFEKGEDKGWYFRNYESRGGSPQRVMPLQHFRLKVGELTLSCAK